ncbi:MAG: ComEC/Rec2 family competence protein [Lachnospiraceae bacterium]|nr:ComEC/Rec2 family competence protein [Lachnospiraceae bacterium]
MRRPLCLFGLVYVAAVWIVMLCRPDKATVCDSIDREQIVAAGYVEWKEYRSSRDTRTPVIHLSDAVILKESQIADLERFLSDSDKISGYELHGFWKENKNSLRKEGTEGIKGILCYMGEDALPEMGSLVMVHGSYRAFLHATNPGEFDAADYYEIMGRQGRIMEGRLLVKSGGYDGFREIMYRIREYLSLLLDASYNEEDASVMKAMLLGEKGMLDAEIRKLYQANGIIHILAVSGLHLSVLGMGCHQLFRRIRMPYAVNIILCAGLMYCYGTMTGMGISMVRAYVMFAMRLLAGLLGRTFDLLTAVTAAALIILLQRPLYLTHSGFLFSFGAVCGIGILLPAVQQNLFGQSRVEKALLSGAAVSVSTLPVYLCFYYEFPPYSVLLNLVVIPCMTLILPGGLISLGAAACYLPLGAAAAYPVHLFLMFYEKCCQLCQRLPGHTWVTGHPAPWQMLVFFGILLVILVGNERLPKFLFWQGILCALLVFCVRVPRGLQITMVDVGQGDCIYLTESGGFHMLIDGGSSDKSNVAEYQILPFLRYKGVSRLDAVVITHPDSDHINGICSMLEEAVKGGGMTIETLYLPDVGEAGRNEGYRELEHRAAEAGVRVRYIGYGDRLRHGNVMLTCLHPEKGWETEDTNAYSTVLHLSYGNFTALFTGDLEGEGERRVEELVRGGNDQTPGGGALRNGTAGLKLKDITLLKAAHHGSRYSTGESILQELNPRIVLLSSGRNNRYGHPHAELLERLAAQGCIIYQTKESGAVTVKVSAERGQDRMSVTTTLSTGCRVP